MFYVLCFINTNAMDNLPVSFNQMYLELISCVHYLSAAIESNDRANIVRSCSNITYCISDILEHVIPDGVDITIK